jgi:asparagine synthase (glutamine-hydrolysing)/putative beta-lactam synthetase
MSGICGWVDFRRDLGRERDTLEDMISSLRHRGPAGASIWTGEGAALALAASPSAWRRGEQAPASRTCNGGEIVAVLDGYVSNARELSEDLNEESPSGANGYLDLLIAAYRRHGPDFLVRLDGAFACAIWDGRSGEMLLARDRLGLKPLYYHRHGGGLLFGSEPKAIYANPLFQRRLDRSKLPILLQPRLALAGETPLVDLHEVKPAHYLRFSAHGASERPYWALRSRPHEEDFAATAEHLRALLAEVVAEQLENEGPCGAMLSGGIDSSSVSALAAPLLSSRTPPDGLDTYCVRFEGSEHDFKASELRPDIDAPYAAAAARHIGSRHHEVSLSPGALAEAIPATRKARDLPGWGQFDASMYLLFGEMSGGCDIALSGEAADEFLGGYPYFFKPEVIATPTFPWLGSTPRLSACLSPDVLRDVDPEEDERRRYEKLRAETPRLEVEDEEEARMREIFYFGMAGPLSVILERKERMSAAWGLEVRIPFCDRRVVEYLWNVPWEMKRRGGVKGLLKSAMADLLPQSTLERRKSAYPHVQDEAHERGLIAEARRIASDREDPVAAFFAPGSIDELVAGLERGAATRGLPGGASPGYMLVHIVELSRWLADYRISVQ